MEYEKYFLEIVHTINKKLHENWPHIIGKGALEKIKETHNDLYEQEQRLDAEINRLWDEGGDFEKFKKTMLNWGRTVLKIYKESEGMNENRSTKAQ